MGMTVFAHFAADTGYFGDGPQQFMVNFRVDDLDGLLAQLAAAGRAHRSQARGPCLWPFCLDLGSRGKPGGVVGAAGCRLSEPQAPKIGEPVGAVQERARGLRLSYACRTFVRRCLTAADKCRERCLTPPHPCRTIPGSCTLSTPVVPPASRPSPHNLARARNPLRFCPGRCDGARGRRCG